jgi:hypothetical protein
MTFVPTTRRARPRRQLFGTFALALVAGDAPIRLASSSGYRALGRTHPLFLTNRSSERCT